MRIIGIHYPVPLTAIKEINNDNIDVFVELEDGITYSVVVSTPLNLLWYMDKENLGHIPAAIPDIIVKSLTDENIRAAISSYAEDDAFWLKIIFLASAGKDYFDIEQINESIKEIQLFNVDLLKE